EVADVLVSRSQPQQGPRGNLFGSNLVGQQAFHESLFSAAGLPEGNHGAIFERFFAVRRGGNIPQDQRIGQAAIAKGWISPARYCARAFDRLSLPELVRGSVRGGI